MYESENGKNIQMFIIKKIQKNYSWMKKIQNAKKNIKKFDVLKLKKIMHC